MTNANFIYNSFVKHTNNYWHWELDETAKSHAYMFEGCTNLKSVITSNLRPMKINSADYMFKDCTSLTSITLNKNMYVNSAEYMFQNCTSLTNINLEKMSFTFSSTVGKKLSAKGMFKDLTNLKKVQFALKNQGDIKDISEMFSGCTNLELADIRSFAPPSNIYNLETTSKMFYNCTKLPEIKKVYVSGNTGQKYESSLIMNENFFTAPNLTDVSSMFEGCSELSRFNLNSFSGLKLYTLDNMDSMFNGCTSLTSVNLYMGSSVTPFQPTVIKDMFSGCENLTAVDLSSVDTSNVVSMSNLFYNCLKLNNIKLGDYFDTSKVTDMSNMFANCKKLSSINLGKKFDTSKVSTMSGMFEGCQLLGSINFKNLFNTKNVLYMDKMFKDCQALTELDLSSFDTNKVTNTKEMFSNCQKLQKITVSSKWNMDKVTDSDFMFYNASKLKGQMGTGYSSTHRDASYAHIDYGQKEPGYFSPTHTAFSGASLTLDGDICVNIIADLGSDAVKVVVDGPNEDLEYTGDELEAMKLTEGKYSGYYKFTYRVSSIQANEKVSIKVYDKYDNLIVLYNANDELLDEDYGYSVNDYITNYTDSGNENLNALVFSLDEYCKAAENYFCNGDHEISAPDNIEDEDFVDYGVEKKGNPKAKIALILNSETAIRINYLTNPDATEMKLVDENENETIIQKEDDGYFYIRNIPADKLSSSYKATFGMKQFNNLSALSYGYAILDNGYDDQKLVDLMKALYQYANAAKTYKETL